MRFRPVTRQTASSWRGLYVQDVGPGGGTRGTEELLLGTTKTVAWRGRVRFLAVAEKTRGTRLLSKQKLFCAPTQLRDCKDITVWDSSILFPKVVQSMTRSPLFFCRPRNPPKWPKYPLPQKTRFLKKRGFGQPTGPAVRRRLVSCATRPAQNEVSIGRGRSRCHIWTVHVRSLLYFSPFARFTPSASRASDVQDGLQGGGYEGSRGTDVRGGKKDLRGEPKCVFSWLPKNPWYAGFPANKNFFVALLSSETAKRSPFFGLVFYVHETVRGMTQSLLFLPTQESAKMAKMPPPLKKHVS